MDYFVFDFLSLPAPEWVFLVCVSVLCVVTFLKEFALLLTFNSDLIVGRSLMAL